MPISWTIQLSYWPFHEMGNQVQDKLSTSQNGKVSYLFLKMGECLPISQNGQFYELAIIHRILIIQELPNLKLMIF